jgi:hypothetical protein
VDVDPGAVPLRKREHDVQMPYRIAIGPGGVDPADHLDTVAESLVEQFGGVRIGEHAVLREGHLLDGDPAAEALPGRPHRLHPASPWSVTTSVCVRTWEVPDATIRSNSAVMCSTFGSPSSPPAVCARTGTGRHGG